MNKDICNDLVVLALHPIPRFQATHMLTLWRGLNSPLHPQASSQPGTLRRVGPWTGRPEPVATSRPQTDQRASRSVSSGAEFPYRKPCTCVTCSSDLSNLDNFSSICHLCINSQINGTSRWPCPDVCGLIKWNYKYWVDRHLKYDLFTHWTRFHLLQLPLSRLIKSIKLYFL